MIVISVRNLFRRGVRALVLTGACVLALSACGSDGGGVLVFVNFGTISADAACDGASGQFSFAQPGGLLVIVIVNDGTDILLASGAPGTCADLRAGRDAEVRGKENSGRVTARQITIQGR
jgi:hypothetical protein